MKKKLVISIIIIISLILGILIVCDSIVAHQAAGRMYDDVDSIPHRKVALIPGTSPISTWTGRRNHYFDQRIYAAAKLYKAGKTDWMVASGGDYRERGGYDEPAAMRDSLIKQGVDSQRIILDYDGIRTLNSVAKMKDVYCQDSIILVSQKYHNERAIFQAKYLGIDAIALNTPTPPRRKAWLRNRGREVFARVKLFIDIASGTRPNIKDRSVRDFTLNDSIL